MPETDVVRLLDYPVALGLANLEHVADWMREFQLMKLQYDASEDAADPRDQLRRLVEQLTARYAADIDAPRRRLAEAAARGDAAFDQEYPLRPESASVLLGVQAVMAAVDEWCARQRLLTLQRPALLVEFSNWVVHEFVRQSRGEEPHPWTGRHTEAPMYLTELTTPA